MTGTPAAAAGPVSLSSTNRTWVGVVPVFSPAWTWAGSQWARPASRATSRVPWPACRRRWNPESVNITLSGCRCGMVLSPGRSWYSSTRTRSFSKMTWYLSGSVQIGSAAMVIPSLAREPPAGPVCRVKLYRVILLHV